jgi:ABC-type Fe3+ transport system permease subunit
MSASTSTGSTFGIAVAGVVVGLGILLAGEATHSPEIVAYTGGAIALAAVGIMTLAIARLPGGDHDEEDHDPGHEHEGH